MYYTHYNVLCTLQYIIHTKTLSSVCCTFIVGYESADLTVHPPPLPELPRMGSLFSYRYLVFPKKIPQRKACAFRSYSG